LKQKQNASIENALTKNAVKIFDNPAIALQRLFHACASIG